MNEENRQEQNNFTIPNATAVPETGETPSNQPNIKNFADNEETVAKALKWISDYKDQYENQSQRETFVKEMDIADEMYRAAKNRLELNDNQSSNVEATGSKIKSSTFYSDIRTITSYEKQVMLGNGDKLPVTYIPDPLSEGYIEDEAQKVCTARNAVLSYNFTKADLFNFLARYNLVLNKYGNILVEAYWDFEEKEIKERKSVLVTNPKSGAMETKIKFVDVKKTVRDWVNFRRYDAKDVWVDAMIQDIQQQNCIIVRSQHQLCEIYANQESGFYKNAEKITNAHKYQGEQSGTNEEVQGERQENAGEDSDSNEPNNLFDVYHGVVRLPIDSKTGKWKPEKQLPEWYEYTFVGQLDGMPICAKLQKLPYMTGEIPFFWGTSHEDDKGIYAMGYSILAKSHIAQEMSLIDMANDNCTIRNRAPFIIESGALMSQKLLFTSGGNQLIIKNQGAPDPKQITVSDTTNNTINMMQVNKEYRQKAMGINKAIEGDPMGSRTSASESISAYSSALKPALESARYKSAILIFMAKWIKDLWDQFSDPQMIISITDNGKVNEVKPYYIIGDVAIQVTAIQKFEDSMLERKEQDQFLNQVLPVYLQYGAIDKKGLAELGKQLFPMRGIRNIDSVLSVKIDYEAIQVAKAENDAIVFGGVDDMPMPEENHEVHIEQHEPFLKMLMLLPGDQQEPIKARIAYLKQHIEAHKQMMQQAQMPVGQPQPGVAPRSQGEMMGDALGAQENVGAPAMGGMSEQPQQPV